ncbi:hypothetical protein BJY04DRAFT_189631 [Aspergillus karnatakaensis]|uniref:uncharacterized protein n=1 Tax=Aspergillus karnatakaensis TaxID=1810916 RepID=UPI003CCE4BE7
MPASKEDRAEVRRLIPIVCARQEKVGVARRSLQRIYRKVTKSSGTFATNTQLDVLHVSVSPLDLETGVQDEKFRTFFKPLSKPELPTINWKKLKLWEPRADSKPLEEAHRIRYNLGEVEVAFLWAFSDRDESSPWVSGKHDTRYSLPTVGFLNEHPYEWAGHSELQAKDLWQTHYLFHLENCIEPQESLSRAELLAISAYMKERAALPEHLEHYYFPILCVSSFAGKARILQAYHDGKNLCISKSDLYDFRENQIENYELFARWMYSKPCGDINEALDVEAPELDSHCRRDTIRLVKKAYGMI